MTHICKIVPHGELAPEDHGTLCRLRYGSAPSRSILALGIQIVLEERILLESYAPLQQHAAA